MSAPLVNRSLATLKTELEFLRDSDVITPAFYDQIVGKLPSRYQTGAPIIDAIGTDDPSESNFSAPTPNEKNSSLIVPQPSGESKEYVEAVYDYKPQQPEDLELKVGDKIQILEHTSPDWWKGSIGSRSGMFPSNYVTKVVERNRAASAAPPYQSALQPQHSNQSAQQPYMYQQQYASAPTQVQFPPYQGSPYQQQQTVPYQAPPPQQQQQVVEQPQQQPHSGHLKKFGSKLGNAAIFGAGATIGSDLVHSIF